MIRVQSRPEPKHFAKRCRERGRRWLREHPGYQGRPYDYWSEFEPSCGKPSKDYAAIVP